MDIAVFGGGASPEHDISVRSARMVLANLDRQRFRVWPVFLDQDGMFWPHRKPLLAGEEWKPGDRSTSHGPMRPGTALDWLVEVAKVRVVFPVLHGPNGEDGRLQGMLELSGVPFVGSDCLASALAMNKQRTRQILEHQGVRVARAYVPEASFAHCDVDAEWERLQAAVGLPAFCKAECSGSSRGVARIASRADFDSFVANNRGTFDRWFAESLVEGEEITVPVLGNRDGASRALPPIGIYPRFSNHFDERAKYEKGACDEICPPPGWSQDRIAEVQRIALRCHRSLGCDGMSRTDMIVSKDGPVVLEVNTIPGMTETSLLPKAAQTAGISIPTLLHMLVDYALDRWNVDAPRASVSPGVRKPRPAVARTANENAANAAG
jgi:D-alanine-D-alanine ligase